MDDYDCGTDNCCLGIADDGCFRGYSYRGDVVAMDGPVSHYSDEQLHSAPHLFSD